MKLKQLLASPLILMVCLFPALLYESCYYGSIFIRRNFFILCIYNNADGYNMKIALIYDSLKHVGELALGFAQH